MDYVICDTVIWYYLGNDVINFPNNSNCHLIGTSVSIREFGVTPNLRLERIHLVKNAVNAFLKYPNCLIKTNPFDYLVKHFFNDFELVNDAENKLLSGFRSLITMDTSFVSKSTYSEVKK
jgi:hypothetical protein